MDHHALLLNDLDFGDPSLQSILDTDAICKVILRSRQRLRTFGIWYNCEGDSSPSNWSFSRIASSIAPSRSSSSLKRFILFGHQNLTSLGDIISKWIIPMRPESIELATCADHLSFMSISEFITSHDIQFRSHLAHYGNFVCSRCQGGSALKGVDDEEWYRICPICNQIFCFSCLWYVVMPFLCSMPILLT
jgi:hypothetical protein